MTTLRILCLGDSLTAGYTAFGTTFTPYAGVMKDALQAWFNKRAERRSDRIMVETVVDGVSGDLIDGGTFRRRIEKRCGFCISFEVLRSG
jgi:hypothetical protein